MKLHPDDAKKLRGLLRRKPVTIVPGVVFVDAQILWVANGRSVLDITWRFGRDTVVVMGPTVARA